MSVAPAVDRAKEVVRTNRYFVLATVDKTGPWTAVLAHTLGPPNCLYFFSEMDSRHGKALQKGAAVAGVMYDSRCSPAEAESLQFSGRGELAHNRASIEFVLREGARRDGQSPPTTADVEAAIKKPTTRLFKITIQEAFVLDQELFASKGLDGRVKVDVKHVFLGLTG